MSDFIEMDEALFMLPDRKDRRAARSRQGIAMILAGTLLIAGAAGLFGYNRMEDRKAGRLADRELRQLEEVMGVDADGDGLIGDQPIGSGPGLSGQTEGETEAEEAGQENRGLVPIYKQDPDMAMPTISAGGQSYVGYLSIPAIDRTLPVMEEWSYPNLKIAPGIYQGTPYENNLIICAHNYERHFGLIKTLEPGDKVVFVDGFGDIFRYRVDEVEILQPTQVEEMRSGDWDLTLFTCTIGGRTRVTVRCLLDEEDPSYWPGDRKRTQEKVQDLSEQGQKA